MDYLDSVLDYNELKKCYRRYREWTKEESHLGLTSSSIYEKDTHYISA